MSPPPIDRPRRYDRPADRGAVGRTTRRGEGEEPGESEQRSDPELRWITVTEIAAILRVSRHSVYKWSPRGWPYFPRHIRLPNGEIRVSEDSLAAWFRECERS